MNQNKYAQEYSDKEFWDKVLQFALSAGREVIVSALKLYYAADDKDTPVWAKTIAITSLGYFIFPMDAIPDLTPVVGYSDDLGVLAAAIAIIAAHIKDEHVRKAEEVIERWF
ncbi:MAG: DUF1232 domain-containing protein [Alphaproteobacteria bacterium]|nr:DUF1232 domain-containing protein [Alphaproteobacteria bacterium]